MPLERVVGVRRRRRARPDRARAAAPGPRRCRPRACCRSSSSATRRLLDTTRLYPGSRRRSTLAGAGRPLAVLTNKPGDLSRTILDGPRVSAPASRASGARATCPRASPTRRACCALMAELGAAPAETWLVGDSPTDVADGAGRGRARRGGHLGLRPGGLARGRAGPSWTTPGSSLLAGLTEELPAADVVLRLRVPPTGPWRISSFGAIRRSLLAGAAARGPPRRSRSLAGLQAALDGSGTALVLAELRQLEAEREAARGLAAQRGLEARRCSWRSPTPATATSVLQRFPSSTTSWLQPVTPGRMRLTLERALDTINAQRRDAPAREAPRPQERGAPRAEQDRRRALGRARHRQAARADPGQVPRDHGRRRRQPLPRRARQGRRRRGRRPAALQARPERLGDRCRSRSARCRSTRPRSPATWRSPARS